jgi:hypothetical protein
MSAESVTENLTNGEGYTGPGKGLVLVFDLDNTIIDTHGGLMEAINNKTTPQEEKDRLIGEALNSKLVDQVLRPAAQLRDSGSGKVDCIFLLTNNSDRNYVSTICSYLARTLESKGLFETIRNVQGIGDVNIPYLPGYFFDYIMVRYHHSRSGSDNPPKRMADVIFMMNALKKPINDLERRTFFFDDMLPKHFIQRELAAKGYADNYIFIKGYNWDGSGGFIKSKADSTDYSLVTEAFKNGVPLTRTKVTTATVAIPNTRPNFTYTSPTYVPHELSEEEQRSLEEEREEEEKAKKFVAATKASIKRPSLGSLFGPPSTSKGGRKKTKRKYKKKSKKASRKTRT